jgi:hypothetical protein
MKWKIVELALVCASGFALFALDSPKVACAFIAASMAALLLGYLDDDDDDEGGGKFKLVRQWSPGPVMAPR